MKTSEKKNITLNTVLSELKALRREVSLFLPTESLDEYTNKDEIKTAYHKAKKNAKST